VEGTHEKKAGGIIAIKKEFFITSRKGKKKEGLLALHRDYPNQQTQKLLESQKEPRITGKTGGVNMWKKKISQESQSRAFDEP